MQERLSSALLEAMKSRLGNRKLICGICGGTRWQIIGVSNIPFSMSLTDSVVFGGPHIPVAINCCEVCGNTAHFNIIALLGGTERYKQLVTDCKTDALIEQALKKD